MLYYAFITITNITKCGLLNLLLSKNVYNYSYTTYSINLKQLVKFKIIITFII